MEKILGHGEDARRCHQVIQSWSCTLVISPARFLIKSSGTSIFRRTYYYCFRSCGVEMWRRGSQSCCEGADVSDKDSRGTLCSRCLVVTSILWLKSGHRIHQSWRRLSFLALRNDMASASWSNKPQGPRDYAYKSLVIEDYDEYYYNSSSGGAIVFPCARGSWWGGEAGAWLEIRHMDDRCSFRVPQSRRTGFGYRRLCASYGKDVFAVIAASLLRWVWAGFYVRCAVAPFTYEGFLIGRLWIWCLNWLCTKK